MSLLSTVLLMSSLIVYREALSLLLTLKSIYRMLMSAKQLGTLICLLTIADTYKLQLRWSATERAVERTAVERDTADENSADEHFGRVDCRILLNRNMVD
jgi:hypothetical protein